MSKRTLLLWFLVVGAHWGLSRGTAFGWQAEGASTSVRATPSSIRRYEPGQWSTLEVFGVNYGSDDTEELVSVYFDTHSQLQFARRFWLPAGAQRKTWLPIRVPADVPPDRNRTTASILRLGDGRDGEVIRRTAGGDLQIDEQPLVVDHESIKSAILFRRSLPDAFGVRPELDWDAYETVYKARESTLLSRVMVDLDADFLPTWPQGFESLDQIILCGESLPTDSAGLANIQQWLQRGGRLWILLDRTQPSTVHALLGNAAGCDIVDRVELSQFDVVDVSRPEGPQVAATWQADEPVELVRVVTNGLEVACRIDGWPAAFWQPVGDGEVLFTTLGPRGWLTESGEPSEPLKMIASRFFSPRRERPLPIKTLQPLLNEQIGYRVPDRRLASAILGLNTLGLLVVGGWLARRQRLDWLAGVVPALALTATGAFLAIGTRNTAAVPSTVALRQIARVEPSTDVVHVSGLAAIYDQQSVDLDLEIGGGTATLPGDLSLTGVTRRGVWDDDGSYRWENLKLAPGGVHYIEFRRTLTLGQPVRALGMFGPDGFSGRLEGGQFEEISDVTVTSRAAPLSATQWNDDRTFTTQIEDVLAPRQYVAGALLSAEQRRRQTILRELLATSIGKQPFVNEPSLLVWSRPWDIDMRWSERYEAAGFAVTAVPLEIERTPAGSEFAVPATFIRIENFGGRHGASSVFNPRTGKWLTEMNKPTNSELRFVLPPQVTPCVLTEAVLTVKVHAPSRRLTISGLVDGQATPLLEKANPSGVLRFKISRPEALQVDEGGGLFLGISISETAQREAALADGKAAGVGRGPSQPSRSPNGPDANGKGDSFDNSTWKIDFVRLDVRGKR